MKHYFEYLFNVKNRAAIESTLSNFLALIKVANLREFNNLLRSFTYYHDKVVNVFLLLYPNDITEDSNKKAKVMKQNSSGVRHFGRFRAKLLIILSSIYTNPDEPVSIIA